MRLPLLADADADGPGGSVLWPGGDGSFRAGGSWDGATATLEESFRGAWRPCPDANLAVTADAHVGFRLPRGLYRAVISGAGASTVLSAELAT